MKYLLTIILSLTLSILFAQSKVDTSNYLDWYSSGENLKGTKLNTIWLKDTEIAQIVHEEMVKAGYEWLNDFQIVRLDTDVYVLAICFSEKSKVGFLFESAHSMYPDKEIRSVVSDYKTRTGNDYYEKINGIDGISNFIKIKNLPKNLSILKSGCYWYQQTNHKSDNKKLVTREDILYVLKQDILQALKSFPAPTN